MLVGIWGQDTERFDMDMIWRFRHRNFVERFGWEDLRRADGREIDQFDNERAIHLALMLEGDVVGYTRLLATDAPHLLSDVYPELMDGRSWPRSNRIYEWTRCAAEKGNITFRGVPISNILMTAVLEYVLAAGIESTIVQTHPKLVQLLVDTGWDVMPLNAPKMLGDNLLVPIDARPSPKALFTHHHKHGITGSVIAYDRCSPNPLTGDPLAPPTYLTTVHGLPETDLMVGE